jgi:hypothetical protein
MTSEVTRQDFVDATNREEAPLMAIWIAMEEQAPETSSKLRSIRSNGVIQFAWKSAPSVRDMRAIEKVMSKFPWVWNTSPFYA